MDLKNANIIILGLPRFDAELESTNITTAKLLAKDNKVYYVENPYTLKDAIQFRNTEKFKKRGWRFSPFDTKIIATDTPNFYVIIPPIVLSLNFLPEGLLFRLLLHINEFLIGFKLRRIIKKLNLKRYIFINSFNFHYPNLDRYIAPILKVYHCLDPLIVEFDRRHGLVSELILIKGSDIVLCSSKQLYEEKVIINSNTYFVPNAADLTHSSKSLDVNLPTHALFDGLKKPIIGYFGAIERRIDYDLLISVVSQNPEMSFALVGPVIEGYVPTELSILKNVIFPGPIPYAELPQVLKGFDVAIVPFKKDEVSRSIFPLKLFEYLGAGKPVVCTDFNPDLEEFAEGQVAFCADAKAFSNAINSAIETNDVIDTFPRIQVAAKNTWERRVNQMATIMKNAIG